MEAQQVDLLHDEVAERTTQAKLKCTFSGCTEAFKRREHLMRHLLRHSGAKPYPCQLCSKAFPRRDTLQRHVSSMHGKDAAVTFVEAVARTTRACKPCAKSKQRCDGEDPCKRCVQRGIRCTRKSTARQPNGNDHNAVLARSQEQHSESQPSSATVLRDGHMQNDLNSSAMRTKTEPAASSAWFDNDYDRFQHARGAARRASIAEVYSQVNAHPAPGASIYPSIEVNEPGQTSTTDLRSHLREAGLSPTQAVPLSATSSRRTSITVPPHSDADIIAAEDFGHVPRLPPSTYAKIVQFYEEQRTRSSSHAALPGIDAMNVFVQLYFEYHHAKLPLLHKATFVPADENWHLVLAIAAVGCEHSEMCSIQLMTMFEHLAMRAISITMTYAPNIESMSTNQSVLIFSHLLLYDGLPDHLLFLQHHRSLLVTTCRRMGAKRASVDGEAPGRSIDAAWRQWILREQERRYVAVVWSFECLQYVTFDMPPTMDTGELTSTFPCHERLWAAATAEDWQRENEKGSSMNDSVATVISQGPVTFEIVKELSDAAFLQVLLTLVVAHKRLQETYNIWIRPRINANDRSDGSVIHKYLDADMENFEQDLHSRPRGDFEISFHMMSIIRFTAFSDLCVAVGLRPGHRSKSETEQDLARTISAEGMRARITLLYAGRLYSHFRSLRAVPRCDLQAFLAASLYIWAWVKFVSTDRTMTDAGSQRSSPGASIRIDQGFESQMAQRWISDAAGLKTQLAGVGVLMGSDAAARVLKEAARILKAKASASTLGRSMADQLVRIVLGG